MTVCNAAAWLLDQRMAEGGGERTAYRIEGRSVSYAELQHEVWRAQHALRQLGVRPGERVALILDDELAFPAWFLGAIRSGVIAVPLSTMLTAGDLAAIVADAGARAVVVSGRYREHLPALAQRAPELRDAVVIGEPAAVAGGRLAVHGWHEFTDRGRVAVAPTSPYSVAFWLYSSGTTGLPKGVMHRQASPRVTAESFGAGVLGIGPDDRCLSVAKLFFAFGLGNSLTFPLSVGASAILNPRRPVPAKVIDLIREERPTLFFASPGFIAAVLDAGPPADAFASVRCTVTAGEALPASLQRRFASRFGHPVLDGIGSTEALHTFLSNTPAAQRPGTSGVPVPGYQVRIVDVAGAEITSADTPGHLQVRGPSLAAGYWNRDAATRAAFRDGWLTTGDVYTRSADGYWTFLGRNNDMIKTGGIWVSPAEVESVLVEHPDVLEAAVVGARNDSGLETTVAFLVPRAGHRIDAGSIDAHCRGRMATFKRPRRILVVDQLPKTATGKVRRFTLRDSLAADRR